jgi:hypothetical protein
MAGINWNEVLVIGLLALCVLGPIVVVLLTQNLLDSAEDIPAEHFDFDDADEASPFFSPSLGERRRKPRTPPSE